jgi:hypothetical protein
VEFKSPVRRVTVPPRGVRAVRRRQGDGVGKDASGFEPGM